MVTHIVTWLSFCRGVIVSVILLSDQVLDWIENHGEAFLSKHTGVGKSLHRARALQKRHDDFEEVAQVRCCVWLYVCGAGRGRPGLGLWYLVRHVGLIGWWFLGCLPA